MVEMQDEISMSDVSNLSKCSEAFPGIEGPPHSYSLDKLRADSLPDSNGNRPIWDKQTVLTADNSLVGHALAASKCSKDFNQLDQENEVRGIVEKADLQVAQSILDGTSQKWQPIVKVSDPLSDKDTAAYRAISQRTNLEAAIRKDDTGSWLMARHFVMPQYRAPMAAPMVHPRFLD